VDGRRLGQEFDVETIAVPCVNEFSDRPIVISSGQLYVLPFTLDLKFFCYSQGRGLRGDIASEPAADEVASNRESRGSCRGSSEPWDEARIFVYLPSTTL
jgi:hypothetical protein